MLVGCIIAYIIIIINDRQIKPLHAHHSLSPHQLLLHCGFRSCTEVVIIEA